MTIDALSLVVCTMMGLALGVDYSLLIVSRFREELAAGRDPPRRPQRTRAHRRPHHRLRRRDPASPRSLLSAFLQPGSLLLSLATDARRRHRDQRRRSPVVALPAPAGPARRADQRRRDRPRAAAGSPLPGRGRWPPPRCAAPASPRSLIAVPLLLLAAPALAFNTGAPGVDELPSSNQARQNAEAIDRAVGPGWEAPFVLVAAAPAGPDHDPASGSPCSAAGSAASPPSPGSGR